MKVSLVTAPTEEPITLDQAKQHLRVDIEDDDGLIDSLIKVSREYAENVTGRKLITQTWKYYLNDWPENKDYIELPFPPLQSVSSITYTDYNGTVNTWSKATDSTGITDGLTAIITGMTDTSDFDAGDIVTVSTGFPSVTLTVVSKTATTMTLDVKSNAVAANVTVTTADNYLVDTVSEPGRIVLVYGGTWPTATLYPMNPIAITFVCGYGTPNDIPESVKQGIKIDLGDIYEQRESIIVGQPVAHLDILDRIYMPNRIFTF